MIFLTCYRSIFAPWKKDPKEKKDENAQVKPMSVDLEE